MIAKKPTKQAKAPLTPITSTYPFEILTIDYLHLDKANGGWEYALVACEHYTKFVQIYATRNKSALAAAEKIYNELVLKFGIMKRIHSDQGKEFDNTLFKRLHKLAGTDCSRTTPYHPQGNGLTERMNRTVINMLKTLEEKEKKNWPKHLSKLAFAYNVTVNSATNFSPYYLVFGREPRLPVDSLFEAIEDDQLKIRKSYEEYTEEWRRSMNQAFEIANQNREKVNQRNKTHYDKKVRGVELVVGDRVLSRNREQGGTGKLRSYWEDTVYRVVDKCDGIPVLVIKPEGGGRKKRIHRNDLLRCNDILPSQQEAAPENKTSNKKAKKINHNNKTDTKAPEVSCGSSEETAPVATRTRRKLSEIVPASMSSEDEDEYEVIVTRKCTRQQNPEYSGTKHCLGKDDVNSGGTLWTGGT